MKDTDGDFFRHLFGQLEFSEFVCNILPYNSRMKLADVCMFQPLPLKQTYSLGLNNTAQPLL